MVYTDAGGWGLEYRGEDEWNERADQWEWSVYRVPLPGVDIDDLDGAWSAGRATWETLECPDGWGPYDDEAAV